VVKLQQNRRKPEFWTDGSIPAIVSPLIPYLLPKLPDLETVEDASIEVLALLRIMNGINRHWPSLYYSVPHSHIILQSEFIHSKVRILNQVYDFIFFLTNSFAFLKDCRQSKSTTAGSPCDNDWKFAHMAPRNCHLMSISLSI
jgi:hypothetical protein